MSFRVVGTASFPSDAGGGLGTGSAFTLAGYLNAVCPPGPEENACRGAFVASQDSIVLARATSGPKGKADIARYVAQGSANRPTIPTSLVNFGEAVNFPLILGFVLALFGVATLLHCSWSAWSGVAGRWDCSRPSVSSTCRSAPRCSGKPRPLPW